MKIDRAYRLPRIVPVGWVGLRHWSAPSEEYPLFDVCVEMNVETLACIAVVYGVFGVIGSVPCLHPSVWGKTDSEVLSIMARFVQQRVRAHANRRECLSDASRQWEDTHPAIVEFMTLAALDDGQERETSMLCVLFEDGLYKVALQDRQEGQSLWVSAQSIPEALEALEARLQAGDGEWRQMRGNGERKRGNNRR